jgi:hypothetical protein
LPITCDASPSFATRDFALAWPLLNRGRAGEDSANRPVLSGKTKKRLRAGEGK